MLHLIERILLWLRGGALKLLILAGIILLVWGTLSPVGTLMWWLNEGANTLGLKNKTFKGLPSGDRSPAVAQSSTTNCYIIFLAGVGNFSATRLVPGEKIFLKGLEKNHPDCVAVEGVFAYSVANESLGGERFLAPLWRFAEQADGPLGMADILIKIRNLWRFAISIDDRYSPIYNQGVASAIIDQMNAAAPVSTSSSSPLKIVLIGTSGGAQVALGATTYLDQWLDAQIVVLSIGGVFAGNHGFDAADGVYHLQGRRDWIEDLGSILFPSRWPWTVTSPFNRARWQGRYSAGFSGPHAHDGSEGYFGVKPVNENDTTYVEITLQKVNQLPIWSDRNSSKNRRDLSP
jgi:hypothetical protein